MGLGLSISYGIIQRHRGSILVDSQIGSGATFIVKIPLDFEAQNQTAEDHQTQNGIPIHDQR
jgi:signal transduction histidine kinase